ncbi:hypothetical protein DPMN_103469 [Dreissena polymorpha]|uniref:Uncharacterized protein n=1 Tax=Dreissena polymorpha TaxID=45954 RepID=A0A9D4H644_DREPO|nr:hypothetical protein DPMN_103469 [Dreissena polymorpha]
MCPKSPTAPEPAVCLDPECVPALLFRLITTNHTHMLPGTWIEPFVRSACTNHCANRTAVSNNNYQKSFWNR